MGVAEWVAIGKFLGAVLFGTATTAPAWAVFAARIALLALASKALAPKLDLSRTAQEKKLTVRDPIYPQAIVYGQDMLSGPIFIANTTGADNNKLTMGIYLTGHEIDSIVSYRLDDVNIPLTDIDTGLASGAVDSGKYADVCEIEGYLGTATQTVSVALLTDFGSLWTAAHRNRGWSYMVWRFTLVAKNTAYETGAPQNIKAVIRGKKCYDPRLDSTNGGAGLHRLNDVTTWAWSDNPAICLADFLRDATFGMKEDDDRIDWPMVATAADICDETVAVPAPVTSQNRYTCNFTFRSDEQRGEIVDTFLTAMLGRLVFSQGVWKMWAGAAVTADVDLDEANLSGSIQVQATAGAKERYNRVRGKYIDPSRDYSASSYVEQRSSSYEIIDGGEVRPLVADFTACNNEFEAQRNAIITLKQSRQQRVVVFQGNLSCFRIQPGTTVTLSVAEYGFSGEKFFVSEWTMNSQGVSLTLVEEIDASWADPTVGEYSTRTKTGEILFANQGVPAPTGVSVVSAAGGVELEWTSPSGLLIVAVEVWASDTDVRANAVLVATVQGDSYFDQVSDNRTRYYWLRSVNAAGTFSVYEPNTATSIYVANNTTSGTDGDDALALNYTNNAHSVPVTLGVEDWAGSGGNLYVFEGVTRLDLFSNTQGTGFASLTNGTYRLNITNVSGDTLTEPAITGSGTDIAAIANWAGNLTAVTVYRIAAYILTLNGDQVLIEVDTTLTPVFDGIDGTNGTNGTNGDDGADAFALSYTNNSHSVPVTNLGAETWTGSGGKFYAYEGGSVLTLDTNTQGTGFAGLAAGQYKLNITKISGDTLTEPTITGAASTEGTLGNWAGNLTTVTVYRITCYILALDGVTQITLATDVTITPSFEGADGADGAAGVDGYNTATLTAYKRAAVVPTDNPGVSIVYTFATAAWTPGNGWTKEIPAGSNPLYALSATAFSQTATDTVLAADWSAPTKVLENGGDGADGLNVATAYIYQRTPTDSAPTLPSLTATYTFATGNITGLNNGWTDTIPAAGANPFLWVSLATASNLAATDAIGSGEWQAAQHLAEDGADGSNGTDGDSVHVSTIYRRLGSAPATPTGGSYNFTTKLLTEPTNWSAAIPAGVQDLYSSVGTWSINGTTGTDSSTTWSSPIKIANGGATIGDLEPDGDFHSQDSPGPIVTDFRINSDGDWYRRLNGGSYTSQGTWKGDGANTDYECRFDLISGSTLIGLTYGTWLACSSTYTGSLTRPNGAGSGTTESNITVRYRRISDNLELGNHAMRVRSTIL